jgi:hypothetical protein
MSQFRNLVGSLGLMGVLSLPSSVNGQEIDYNALTTPAITNLVEQRAENVTYTFNQAINGYAGASIVLFGSTCYEFSVEQPNRNMEIVFLQLLDKFRDTKVGRYPIKFAWYDTCGRREAEELGVTTLETHMYLDGREIDILRGGPNDKSWIQQWFEFLGSEWIPTNLTNKNGSFAWRFNGTSDERQVFYQP